MTLEEAYEITGKMTMNDHQSPSAENGEPEMIFQDSGPAHFPNIHSFATLQQKITVDCMYTNPKGITMSVSDWFRKMEERVLALEKYCLDEIIKEGDKIPNQETRDTLDASAQGIDIVKFNSVDELMKDLMDE